MDEKDVKAEVQRVGSGTLEDPYIYNMIFVNEEKEVFMIGSSATGGGGTVCEPQFEVVSGAGSVDLSKRKIYFVT